MKKGHKILALFLLGLFAISIIAGIVAAQTLADDTKNFLSNSFSSISSKLGGTRATIGTTLLTILLILLVYSIVSFIPFIEGKPTVQLIISIIVGILGTLYLVPADIKAILTTYSALGIVLTTIFPLIILITFDIKLTTNTDPKYGIATKAMWMIFIGYLLYAWATAPSGTALTIIYIITLVAVVVWWFFGKYIKMWWLKSRAKAGIQKAENAGIADRTAEIIETERRIAVLSAYGLTIEAAELQDKVDNLKKIK